MAVNIDSSEVELIIAGQNVAYNESYTIKQGIFDQPNTFNLTFGWGQSIGKMLENITPFMPFELRIGGRPAFKGKIGRIRASESKGSTMTLAGRDQIAELMRYKTESNVTFSKATHVDLLDAVLERIGLPNQPILGDYAAFAVKRSGHSVTRYKTVLDPVKDAFTCKESISEINSQVKTKTGMTWFSFLQEYFNRAGLFLWGGPNGEYILSRPNPNQEPTYRIVRGREPGRSAVNAKLIDYDRDYEDRHATISVNARSGGTKAGRNHFKGSVDDDELIALGLRNYRAVRDRLATNPEQAEGLAHRIRAEERRKGFKLIYEVAGHTGITPRGGRAVYAIDTVVQVNDDELGLDGPYYLHEVECHRNVGDATITRLSLLPPEYLVF